MISTILFWIGCYAGAGLLLGGVLVLGDSRIDTSDSGMIKYWRICQISMFLWPILVGVSAILVLALMTYRAVSVLDFLLDGVKREKKNLY